MTQQSDESSDVIRGYQLRQKVYPKTVDNIILPLHFNPSSLLSSYGHIVNIRHIQGRHGTKMLLSPINKHYAILVATEKEKNNSRDGYLPSHIIVINGNPTRVRMKSTDQGYHDKLRYLKTYYIFPKNEDPEKDYVLKIKMKSPDDMEVIRGKTSHTQQEQNIGRRQSSSRTVQTPQTTGTAKTQDKKPSSRKTTNGILRWFGF